MYIGNVNNANWVFWKKKTRLNSSGGSNGTIRGEGGKGHRPPSFLWFKGVGGAIWSPWAPPTTRYSMPSLDTDILYFHVISLWRHFFIYFRKSRAFLQDITLKRILNNNLVIAKESNSLLVEACKVRRWEGPKRSNLRTADSNIFRWLFMRRLKAYTLNECFSR